MPQDIKHSVLKEVVKVMSKDHDGYKPDATMYYRVKPAEDKGCPWRTSEEDHWVAHFASCLLDHARGYRQKLEFHQYFEKPSHGSEHKLEGGYDLSCGPYDNRTFRVRSMQKVLKGLWCDCSWDWELEGSEAVGGKEATGDRRHLRSLLEQKDFATYLVLNVFYCLHDWRRMGEQLIIDGHNLNGFTVPHFSCPLRTLIVDLAASKDKLPIAAKIVLGCRGLQQPVKSVREWEDQTSAKDFMYARANDKPLEIVTFNEIIRRMDAYWKDGKVWASSKLT